MTTFTTVTACLMNIIIITICHSLDPPFSDINITAIKCLTKSHYERLSTSFYDYTLKTWN